MWARGSGHRRGQGGLWPCLSLGPASLRVQECFGSWPSGPDPPPGQASPWSAHWERHSWTLNPTDQEGPGASIPSSTEGLSALLWLGTAFTGRASSPRLTVRLSPGKTDCIVQKNNQSPSVCSRIRGQVQDRGREQK